MDYQSAKWKKKREKILKLDKYKDRVAAMFGRTAAANTVHHIYPAAVSYTHLRAHET